MALTQIDDRGLKTPIDLLDNEKIRLGTGNDLELYHSGSASYIDAGTTATELISDDLRLRSKTGNETYINADVNGAVELYHDNTLRFLTNSIGAQCQGDFSIPLDNEELRIGAGNDFRVKHDGTNTIMSNNTGALYISGDDIRLTNAATDESYIKGVANGAVELYYDNSKKFETISTGVKVQSSAAHCHLKINSANSNSSVIHFGTAADDDMAQIWYDDYSDALYYRTSTNTPQIFYTNNAERMRIDSSGNVGIGVVPKSGQYSGYNHLQVGECATLSSNDTNSDTNITNLTHNAYLDATASNWKYLHSDEASRYQQYNGIHYFSRASSGSADANISFTEKLKIDSDGLKFNGDTAAANALDDYEEGTWTPTVSSGMTSPTYSHQRGGYVKIGRLVYFQFDIAISGGTGNSNHLKIGGLPFTSESSANYAYSGAFMNYQNSFLDQGSDVTLHIGLNSTDIKFYKWDGNWMAGNSSALNDLTANIIVNGLYMAAS